MSDCNGMKLDQEEKENRHIHKYVENEENILTQSMVQRRNQKGC